MRSVIATLLIFISSFVFAQNSEIWKKDANDEVISTLESYSPERIDPPIIFLKYSYDDENGSEPGGSAESGEIIEKNFGLFNEGALKIKYSGGGNYSSLVEFGNGLTKFNTGINVSGTSIVSGLSWNKDDVFIENGSIGIGTALSQLLTMNEKLYVKGATSFDGETGITGDNYLEFGKGVQKPEEAGKIAYQKWSDDLDIMGAGDELGSLQIRLWDYVTIGNRNIGPQYEDAELQVNGMIVAKKVIVTLNNWADYVFTSDYELKSLTEVEEYISENGHLPNIPNSTTVKNDGVDLADMNRLLLEKVEELTLYVIDLQSQINAINSKDTK